MGPPEVLGDVKGNVRAPWGSLNPKPSILNPKPFRHDFVERFMHMFRALSSGFRVEEVLTRSLETQKYRVLGLGFRGFRVVGLGFT